MLMSSLSPQYCVKHTIGRGWGVITFKHMIPRPAGIDASQKRFGVSATDVSRCNVGNLVVSSTVVARQVRGRLYKGWMPPEENNIIFGLPVTQS